MNTKYVPGNVLKTGDTEVNTAVKFPSQHPGADIGVSVCVCVCDRGEGRANMHN